MLSPLDPNSDQVSDWSWALGHVSEIISSVIVAGVLGLFRWVGGLSSRVNAVERKVEEHMIEAANKINGYDETLRRHERETLNDRTRLNNMEATFHAIHLDLVATTTRLEALEASLLNKLEERHVYLEQSLVRALRQVINGNGS